jgi:hypothetical protein
MASSGIFQSGREVFEHYIPNYVPQRYQAERFLDGLTKCASSEFVEDLLKDFSHELTSISQLKSEANRVS